MYARRKAIRWIGGIAAALAILAILGSASCATPPTPPLTGDISISRAPNLGETAAVTFTFYSIYDLSGVQAEIVIPQGAQLASGSNTWTGDLTAWEKVTISCEVLFTVPGEYKVTGQVWSQVSPEGHAIGDLESVAMTVRQEGSHLGLERALSIEAPTPARSGSVPPEVEPVEGLHQLRTGQGQPPPESPYTPDDLRYANTPRQAGNVTIRVKLFTYDEDDDYVGARYTLLEFTDTDGTHLAWGWSDGAGDSETTFANPYPKGIKVRWRTYFDWSGSDNTLMTIVQGGTGWGDDYKTGYIGPYYLADGYQDLGEWYMSDTSDWRKAWVILEEMQREVLYIYFNTDPNDLNPGDGTAEWTNGDNDGTYYSLNTGRLNIASGDWKSEDIVPHEYAHRIMHVQYGGYFPPFPNCNPHWIQYASSQGCAWTEGWADFMCLVTNGNPYFEWASGSYLDLENRGWGDGWDEGDEVEGRVAGSFWDWTDPAGETWDYSDSYPYDYIWDTFTGQIDDIFYEYWVDWMADGRPVYNPCYSMYQNTIVYDDVGPDDWRYFSPTYWWTADQTPWCYVQARDIMSGLRVSNGGWYRYTNNGGSTWSGWVQADAVGGSDGTTSWQWIDVYDVPFNNDSGTQNYIQFAIADMEWNWGYSPAYLVQIDTAAPWNPTSYGGDPPPGEWTNETYITAWWSGFGDATSGVDGFAVLFNKDAHADPGYTKNVEEDAQTTEGPFSDGDWWITFRTVDNAGNWAATYVYGYYPWKIDTVDPWNPKTLDSDPDENVWTNDNTVYVEWSDAGDGRSGLDGYSYSWTTSPTTRPDETKDSEENQTNTTSSALSDADWYFHLITADNAGNWTDDTKHLGPFKIDKTAPTNPTSFTSDPAKETWSNDDTIKVSWSGASDARSGIDGYSYLFDDQASSNPDKIKDCEETTTSATSAAMGTGYFYFHIRTLDNAGNWSTTTAHYGPFWIDTKAPAGWRNFEPSDWVADLTPDCTVEVKDSGLAGLKVDPSTAGYRYSTDGGSSWSGWQKASVTGVNGSMNYETITASDVPFNQTSEDQNLIDFRIDDLAGNTGYSPGYVVKTARETASDSGYFNLGWVWFSIPLDPDGCCGGGNCYDPIVILGFDVGGDLFKWDKYGKYTQVYQPPFLKWDLSVGNSYLLRLEANQPDPAYWGLDPASPFEFLLGKQGWTWVGKPGIGTLTGNQFMDSVRVQYPVGGTTRTAQEDYNAIPNNWVSWGWSFWDPYLDAVKTFTPYAPFGNRTCYPWYGYRMWVNVGTAPDEYDRDQVLMIWP